MRWARSGKSDLPGCGGEFGVAQSECSSGDVVQALRHPYPRRSPSLFASGPHFSSPSFYEGDSITPEQLLALGDDIVVKANHDSGSVVILRENTPEAAARACMKIAGSLRRNYGEETREWWYARVKPKVFVECFLSDDIGSRPFDLKFFVFRSRDGGSPRAVIEVDHERGTPDHHRTFYDENGNVLKVDGQGVRIDSQPNLRVPFPRPEKLDEMRRLACASRALRPHPPFRPPGGCRAARNTAPIIRCAPIAPASPEGRG